MIDNDNDMMLKGTSLIFSLPFCLQVIDDIFTVLSLHFGACSLTIGKPELEPETRVWSFPNPKTPGLEKMARFANPIINSSR